MSKELKILELADYYKKFEVGSSSAYLILNKNMAEYQLMFGFTELSDDFQEVKKLFELLEDKARSLGYKELVGPINYCTWMSYRWTISNYDFKLFPDCNNPKFYVDFIEKLGYKQLLTYRSAVINLNNPMFEIGEKCYNDKLQEGYIFKTFKGKEAFSTIKEIYDISVDAFSSAYLYSEIPFEIFKETYLYWINNLDANVIIAYKDNKAIGYVFGYDNPVGDGFISKTSAVIKNYQKDKVYTALLYLGWKYVIDSGYKDMIYHFQCEQKETFKKFDKSVESNEKRYAVYVKEI